MSLLYLAIGIAIGLLFGILTAFLLLSKSRISKKEVEGQYVHKSIFEDGKQLAENTRLLLRQKEDQLFDLSRKEAILQERITQLDDQLLFQKKEMREMENRFQFEFERLADRLLEEKSSKFTQLNQNQLKSILEPLKEKIKAFEENLEKKYLTDTHDRISLKKEIEHLRDLNSQLSQDANNLVHALRGNSKTQGDWGELRLELLLEKAGLKPGIHFEKQLNFKDQQGFSKRPDFVINLPEKKHLIIDAKVSLTAYERFHATEDQQERQTHLKAHISSVRKHIKSLGSKSYEKLYDIQQPDYLLMFIPIESAFSLAIEADNGLFMEALEKNIVLVTTSTLLATMRTVSFIWKQEKQKESVAEIARQSGFLYDKFCGFVEDLQQIGHKLDGANQSYQAAMNKLKESRKFGDTLIGRAKKIKELGAKSNKKLPNI